MPSPQAAFANLVVVDHPLVRAHVTLLRDRTTSNAEFRRAVGVLAGLVAVEATRGLALRATEVETLFERAAGAVLARPVTVVPVLRAGLGMADAVLALVPGARVGHVGIYRNEKTLEPVTYYAKFPTEIAEGSALLVDPMLATGGTACRAAALLKEKGVAEIALLCLVAAPTGVRRMLEEHPDVRVFAASLDRELSTEGRILPGVGDAGDRIFGTEGARAQR